MNELIIGGRTFGSRLFVGTGKFRSNDEMAQRHRRFGHRDGYCGYETRRYGEPCRRHAYPRAPSGHTAAAQHIGRAQCKRSRTGGSARPRGLRYRISSNSKYTPTPSIFCPTRWKRCEPPKNWLNGIRGAALHPGRPCAVQAPRRSRSCHGYATLAAPIGTNKGLVTRDLLEIIIEQSRVPVVVDAGLGAPSHAAEAMELGADAVLVNTAIAVAGDPVAMARALPRQ